MPDALIRRFENAVATLLDAALTLETRVGLAVSGGADSMALLDLAASAFPGRVEASTVDHGLRPESREEAAMVAGWCASNAIPHATLHPAERITGSVQAEARSVRYALLDAWMDARALDWLLTAHHADDQLETLVMRLNRASGVAGLAGIRARRGRILRPLLGVRKAELVGHAQARGLPFVEDPSNSNPHFDRARLRMSLVGADWLDPIAASASAAALADAEAALAWSVARLLADHVRREKDVLILTETALPHEYLRRILLHLVAEITPDARPPRGESLDEAIVQLCRGMKISIGACVATGGTVWTIRRAPPRRQG